MTNGTNHVPATTSPADRVLTPAQVLVEFFLANADRGCNAENDLFIEELLRRRREIQSLANPIGAMTPRQRGAYRMGRHSRQQNRHTPARRTVEMVDISGTAHRLTTDAAADGLPRGRYSALCGQEVLPAALVAREARFCRLCVPAQRSRW